MTLDIRTLFIMAVPGAFLFFAVQLAVWSVRRRDTALLFWALSNLAGQIGALLVAMRGQLPEWWSIPVSQSLILGSVCLTWAGMRSFSERPLPLRESVVMVLALTAALTAMPFISENFGMRTAITSLFLAVGNLIIGWELWQAQRLERLRARGFLTLVFIAQGLFYAYRTWVSRSYAHDASVFQAEPLQALTLLVANLKLIAWNLGALLMANERLANRLQHAATCDALTNVLNRAGFRDLSGQQMQRSQEGRRPVSVLLMDIDFFKKVNDGYGHDAGDKVLCAFAETARKSLRPTDLLARHGGEEFCALLPESDRAAALVIAERVRASFEAHVTTVGESSIRATVSIGVAELKMPDEQILNALNRADAALYRAKAEGRNRVCLATA